MTGEPLRPSRRVRARSWRRPAKRVAIVLGGVLAAVALLCCAGVAYVAYDAYRAPHEQRDMEAFAHDVCRDLIDGDADAVFAALSAGARDRYSAQQLASDLIKHGRLTRCEVVRATFLVFLAAYVRIEDDHGEHTFDLVKEAGEWKVASDIRHDLDSPPRRVGGGGGFDD